MAWERLFGSGTLLVVREPDVREKIALLSNSARFDVCGADEGGQEFGPGMGAGAADMLRHLHTPAGAGSRRLLKVLLTDACPNRCRYCAFRAGSGRRRTSFKPEELAGAFMGLHDRGLASGIFLSSGLGGDRLRTMESMLQTIEILRRRHQFPGYVHLKILPGATDDYVEAACRLADRVSSNLEVPNPERLAFLCPDKTFEKDLAEPLKRVAAIRREGNPLSFGTTTQFVVGAAGESDREILETTARFYAEARLTRAHFSAFRPIPGTPLEDFPATPASRQRRLYQADTLLRLYGFSLPDLPLQEGGNLAQEQDPKLACALLHPERFPLEVNRATREELLKVPGIGPRAASAVLRARRSGRITSLEELGRFPLLPARAAPFILVDGKRPEQPPVQGGCGRRAAEPGS